LIKNPQDRRKHPRLEGNIPLKISSADFDIVTETSNVSCAGAYCRVNKQLEPMTKLKIHLLLPFKSRNNKTVTKKVSCQGIIVRTEEVPQSSYYNVAIYFNDISPKDLGALSEYIGSSLAQNKDTKQPAS